MNQAIETLAAHIRDLRASEEITGSVSVKYGRKYAKIIIDDNGSRYPHCFVEIATGCVLKADTWTRPARGVRGNVNTPEAYGVTSRGAFYHYR